MHSVIEYAKSKGIRIVEDAAEMLGQSYTGKPIGSFGDISTFSFFANKNITTGEGGAILTNDEDLSNKINKLKNLGFGEPRFVHESFGTNARLTNIQCAIGLGQLENLQLAIDKKRAIANIYNVHLQDSIFQIIPRCHEGEENIYWVYPVMMKNKELRDRFLSKLRVAGIDTRPFFYPLNKQPVLKETEYFYPGDSISLDLYNRGFYIPSGLGMELIDFEDIANIMLELSKEL
jgi:perosamine synthetase